MPAISDQGGAPAVSDEIAISLITIAPDRQRRSETLDTTDLERSIAKRGLMHPIVIDQDNQLIAGFRRLTSCRNLGWTQVPFRRFVDLSPVECQILELEENVRRRDLPWQDNVAATWRIHQLFCQLDPEWTLGETSEEIGLSTGKISQYISVARELGTPRVASAGTINEAYNVLERKSARVEADALEEILVDYTQPEVRQVAEASLVATGELPRQPIATVPAGTNPVLQTSFLEWAPAYSGPKFNLIHCDFPYGIEVFSGPQGRGAEPTGYKDNPELFRSLLECLCQQTDRLASLSAHLMFWCRLDAGPLEALTRATFRELAPSWQFQKFPLIWLKSDNAGISSEARFNPRHIYETCLLASRGKRQIVKIVGDGYASPTDKTLHPSTKPEPMLRHFMSMLVDENTSLLDPTAGSGAALRAADSLGAKRVLGLEVDPTFVAGANGAFRKAKVLREASRAVGK